MIACSPTNTASSLSDFPDDGYFFRTAPPDSLQARALGRAIAETGGPSAAILYVDDDYGRGIDRELNDELTSQGTNVVERVALDPNLPDYHDQMAAVLAAHPATDRVRRRARAGVRVLSAAARPRRPPRPDAVFVTDGMRVNDLSGRLGTTGPDDRRRHRGHRRSAPHLDTASWFQDALRRRRARRPRTSTPPTPTTARTSSPSPPRSTGSDDPTMLRRGDARRQPRRRASAATSRLRAAARRPGRNIDLDGASGLIEFGSNGDPEYGTFDLFRFDAAGRDMTERQISVRSR